MILLHYCLTHLRILGSCRGFILLRYIEEEDDLILWNPSTGARKTISCSPGRKLFYGFVYDTSTDDYLVIVVVTNEAWTTLKADIEFFSLKTNSWNKIKGINFPYSCIGLPGHEFISGLLLNGALHWLTLCKGTGTDVASVIIAFDLIERSLSEIPLPSDFTAASRSRSVVDICHFMVIGGCLGLCCRRPFYTILRIRNAST
ncbi:F-box/kelch-repeat protein At3g06240-like [Gastrolobium bilobum]|uniref:F-box/kelch-repeat protein At3g06240-like n=1 Tax=Gastrolobium bilobum TaxID=150636 RepID=UPI002AB176E1|nr:F-box/kelch-repeat protein At3g06240-like [Gastrolobium bilobum]